MVKFVMRSLTALIDEDRTPDGKGRYSRLVVFSIGSPDKYIVEPQNLLNTNFYCFRGDLVVFHFHFCNQRGKAISCADNVTSLSRSPWRSQLSRFSCPPQGGRSCPCPGARQGLRFWAHLQSGWEFWGSKVSSRVVRCRGSSPTMVGNSGSGCQ